MMSVDLVAILSCACRRKIIEFLSENGSTNIMQLILKINGKYSQVNAELQILQKEDLIIEKRVGRMRIIRLNKENPNTDLLLQALKLLHSNDKKQ